MGEAPVPRWPTLERGGTRNVLVLDAGRSDYRWDLSIQMPAALTFASSNPFYDWRYASYPEAHMGGRRVAHARGNVFSVLERGPATNPLFQAFLKAAQESGFPLTDDVNGCPELGLEPLEEDLEPQRVS